MLVRIEIQLDDVVLSVAQEDRLAYASSSWSGGAALLLGRAVGKIVAAMGTKDLVPIDVMIEELHDAVLRSARPPDPDTHHTCDGVACC